MWGKFNSSIHGFEAINKAARWNYQRDRIYIRTDLELKKVKRKKKNLVKRAVHISRVVVCQLPPVCPLCQREGFRRSRTITKRLHDLRFRNAAKEHLQSHGEYRQSRPELIERFVKAQHGCRE